MSWEGGGFGRACCRAQACAPARVTLLPAPPLPRRCPAAGSRSFSSGCRLTCSLHKHRAEQASNYLISQVHTRERSAATGAWPPEQARARARAPRAVAFLPGGSHYVIRCSFTSLHPHVESACTPHRSRPPAVCALPHTHTDARTRALVSSHPGAGRACTETEPINCNQPLKILLQTIRLSIFLLIGLALRLHLLDAAARAAELLESYAMCGTPGAALGHTRQCRTNSMHGPLSSQLQLRGVDSVGTLRPNSVTLAAWD